MFGRTYIICPSLYFEQPQLANTLMCSKLYLPAAEYGPAGESKDGKKGRPQPAPDSFHVVVVGR